MTTFFPATGTEADWNAAYYRLEDYFRALRVVNKVHQSQLILYILERAAARHVTGPELNPTELSMEEARAVMDHWFEGILGPRERLIPTGLISLLVVNAAERWPLAFLSDDVPATFRNVMQESEVRAGPDLQVSSMVPRPIDVSPLLETINLAATLGKAKAALMIVGAMMLLAAVSASLLALVRW